MPLHRQVADERKREEVAVNPLLFAPDSHAVVPRLRIPTPRSPTSPRGWCVTCAPRR